MEKGFIWPNAPAVNRAVGRAVRAARLEAGLSQEQLCELLRPNWPDIGRGQVSHFERGRRRLHADQLYLIAEVLGIEVSTVIPSDLSVEQESTDE